MLRDEACDAALDPRTMTPEWYAHETRLAHMLPYVSLVDDRTVRTRVNELFQCVRLDGCHWGVERTWGMNGLSASLLEKRQEGYR